MASWFSGSAALGLGDTLNGLKDKVKTSVENNINPNLIKNLQNLTLQSDEMVAERTRFEEEERRKENVRDSLAEIFPWETRDKEMEILVDECKDVILKLSSRDETFTSPFVLPGGLLFPDDEDGGERDEEMDSDEKAARDLANAEVSAEKLSKLQPLPTLLGEDFDLDTHVGLIQRLLKVDEKLVEMHSRLSSGGRRELVFWKNYFFQCAFARYEAGLSIDEIWSTEGRRPSLPVAKETVQDDIVYVPESPEEEVVFDSNTSVPSSTNSDTLAQEAAVDSIDTANADVKPRRDFEGSFSVSSVGDAPKPEASESTTSSAAADSSGLTATDYEFVSGGDGDDASMDELEAEIAAALGN